MPGKILRRCTLCNRFHASYIVEIEDKKAYLCYDCWKAKQNELASVEVTNEKEIPLGKQKSHRRDSNP